MTINQAVSKNLKAIRGAKELNLDQAAKLTGVSKSMLGQIERGETNPTISILWKIANGLKISFSEIIVCEEKKTDIIREITPLIEDEGRYLNYPVFPFDENRGFETYRIELLPGGLLKAEPHLPKAEELLIVFEGVVEISVDTEWHHLKKGDAIRFKADVYHSYENKGDEKVMLAMIISYKK